MSKQFNSGLMGTLVNTSLVSTLPETKPFKLKSTEILPFEIKYNELKFDKTLGKGTYGKVSKADYRKSQVAVKEFFNFDPNTTELLREAKIMSELRSEYLVGFRGICFDPCCLVMEYCEGGALSERLQTNEAIPLNLQMHWALQITYGLQQLHLQKILHRDLKSANILLDGQNNAKIADFGLSTVTGSIAKSRSARSNPAGTLPWMAPELHKRKSHSQETDVYSLGVVLWEIASRRVPYAGLEVGQMISETITGRQDLMPDGPKVFLIMINACWHLDPLQRPTTQQIGEEFSKALKNLENLPVPVSTAGLSTSHEKESLLEKLSILTSQRDNILRQMQDGGQHSKLEKELDSLLKQISEIENVFREQKENKSDSLMKLDSQKYASVSMEDKYIHQKSEGMKPGKAESKELSSSPHRKSITPISRSSQSLMPARKPKASPEQLKQWEQQDVLIAACKEGDEKKVGSLLRLGAKPNMSNEKGEQPFGAAVWSMCPGVLSALLEQNRYVTPMTWEKCTAHNQKYYNEIFIVPKFDKEEWYNLLLKIEPNLFIRDFHLEQVKKVKNHMDWERLKKYVEPLGTVEKIGLGVTMIAAAVISHGLAVPGMVVGATTGGAIKYHDSKKIEEFTEKGLKEFRDQIREKIDKALVLSSESSSSFSR